MQPTPVKPVAPSIVLDQDFAANAVAHMKALGAKNVDPPLSRSAYLKNIKTGLVLPWSAGLAEQRDIMVNCDANGNTDPSAWAHTVNPVMYTADERNALHEAALNAVKGYQQYETPPATPMEWNPPVEMPHGARHLDEFMAERNQELIDIYEAAL